MMQFAVILLSGSLLFLGGVAFVAIARPSYLIGWVAWWMGEGESWRQDRLAERDQSQYYSMIIRSYPVLLLMVFAWAFLVGTILALSRL